MERLNHSVNDRRMQLPEEWVIGLLEEQ